MSARLCILALSAAVRVYAQSGVGYPQNYSGIPAGDYSPEWQNYFQVTEPLPNISFPLGRNWAGNIGVNRAGHPNDTLFFWAFEKENGSLTATGSDEPWGIWLNGGPGSSSLVGLHFENGPIHIQNDYSIVYNNYSWDTVADYVWIDQPVGVGFATADANGFVPDEDQMGLDFLNFLENLVKVFPGLATRPLHLTGESYAGMYIPYITKAYFQSPSPPVKLAKIAIGDGSVASGETFELLPVVSVLETYPQIIGYDTAVLEYFKEQEHLCGYDLNLTYPQDGHFPTLGFINPQSPALSGGGATGRRKSRFTKQSLFSDLASRHAVAANKLTKRDRVGELNKWKRDLTGRANGTVDPWYGCDVYDEMLDYAINFTYPWSLSKSVGGTFDYYDVPDALSPEAPMDASVFLNNNQTRAAIHAPTSKDWYESIEYMFSGPEGEDPSVEPMAFLTELATNATAQNLSVVLYSGNDDSLIPHTGTQVTIQNTTFGGIQGFTRVPSTPWYDDSGNFAGIVHQERNWTYVLVKGAGHLVGYDNPTSALVFIREFVFGSNETGLVTNSSGGVTVVGGENSTLAESILPGQAGIYYGSGTTQSTYFFPSATVAAWDSFIATATSSVQNAQKSSASRTIPVSCGIFAMTMILLFVQLV